MPKQTKTCRVCGKEYEACRSIRTGDKAFNWREVACSPECGSQYLEKVLISRGKIEKPKPVHKAKAGARFDPAPAEIEIKTEEVAEGEQPTE